MRKESQMSNQETSIVRRVRKLLKLAKNNPSAEESAAAAAKAQDLIDQHKIDEALLAAEQKRPAEDLLRDVSERVIWQFGGRSMTHWIVDLCRGVVQANGLYGWTGWEGGKRTYAAAGPEEDLMAASILVEWLVSEVGHLIEEERRTGDSEPGRSWANSFRMGCSYMIAKRVRESAHAKKEKLQREAEPNRDERYKLALEAGDQDMLIAMDGEQKEESPRYSLALVQTALEIIEKQKVENKGWARRRHSFKSGRSYSGTTWGGGFSAGVKAGKRAKIDSPKRLGG
jgi:hypothetical protein